MSIIIRLPITVASDLPVVPSTDIESFTRWEAGSYEHWIFDSGTSANLTGLNQGKLLTAQGQAPTYGSNYLSLASASGNALLTDKTEVANQVGTICCVFKAQTSWNGFHFPFGTLAGSGGGANGGAPFFSSAAGYPRDIYAQDRGMSPASNVLTTIPLGGQWYFLAQSRNFNSASKQRITLLGGQAISQETVTGTYNFAPGRFIGLGNGYYAVSTTGTMDFAEFILFDRALSAAELLDLYQRRKSILALSGIAVV